jgi:predicted MPP superfamily phosphohydrolase
LIFDLISKIFKKSYSNLFGFIAIGVTVIYLGIGAYLDFNVFETHYDITTNKDIGFDEFKIIQISDSHIGATFDGDGFRKHIERISKIDADIVVITGDFIDDDTTYEDMVKSCAALSLLNPRIGVYFVYGNHDRGYYNYRGYSGDDLEQELIKNNVFILKDQISYINDKIYIVGRLDKSFSDRKPIQELVSDIGKDKYIIDLNHQPNDYENEKNSGVDLVLSGHSHGGQIIPLGLIGKLTKANEEYYGLHKKGNTTFIVNSGISNWLVSFKTGTKSEYSVITIRSTYEENNPL